MKARKPQLERQLAIICALMLAQDSSDAQAAVLAMGPPEGQIVASLASAHHVILRSLLPLSQRRDSPEWLAAAVEAERARIANALEHLAAISQELEAAGCPVTVIKSLDHWPDLGADIDLYTSESPRVFVEIFKRKFQARVRPPTWGDRLANKWNFHLPTLMGPVEVHTGRLGQMGEHTALASRFELRAVSRTFGQYVFRVPAPEEQVIAAALQRMYRHFYFRVCDLANAAVLILSDAVDYTELRKAAELGGIWPGVATYLGLVAAFVAQYQDKPLPLPTAVLAISRFGVNRVAPRGRYFKIPIIPEAAGLYVSQISNAIRRGQLAAAGRLSLLPPLACIAAVAHATTGTRAIW